MAVTVIRRLHRYPSPAPTPSQRMSLTRRATSGCSGHPDRPDTTTRTARRSLARATNLAAIAARGGKGGQSTTRSTPSINAAVTSAQTAFGRGITASRVEVDADVVGSDGTQAGEADQSGPRTCLRRGGQKGQRHADAPAATPVRVGSAADLVGDHDGVPPPQALVGKQPGQGWDHREEPGLARGDRPGALGQECQGPLARVLSGSTDGCASGWSGSSTNICS